MTGRSTTWRVVTTRARVSTGTSAPRMREVSSGVITPAVTVETAVLLWFEFDVLGRAMHACMSIWRGTTTYTHGHAQRHVRLGQQCHQVARRSARAAPDEDHARRQVRGQAVEPVSVFGSG